MGGWFVLFLVRRKGMAMRTRVLLAVVALLVAACSAGGGEAASGGAASGSDSAPVEIAIRGFAFGPAEVTVAAGTTVTWVNKESGVPHTSTSDDGLWKSGTLSPGDSFSFTFDRPGTYTYFCSIHPNMKGTIVVQG